jgi:hypothetical protein
MYVNLTPLGNGTYRARVGKNTYTFPATPGQVIWLGGQKVTVPGATPGSASTPSQVYNKAAPFLTPDEQQSFNQNMTNISLSDIDLGAAHEQAHVNYQRSIADIAHQALVQSQNVEENMAQRGQFSSGLRDSALIDVDQHRVLAETRAGEDQRAADILYEAKHGALNTARGDLQNWYTLTAGQNAKDASTLTPQTQAGQTATPLVAKPPTAKPATGGIGPAPGFNPGVNTHPGQSVPGSHTASGGVATYPSGPPPSKTAIWNGYKWTHV